MGKGLSDAFEEIFKVLRAHQYDWMPQTPERLIECRKDPGRFSPLVQYFGLGISITSEQLVSLGLPERLIPLIQTMKPAISLCGEIYLAHDHWPPRTVQETSFVYYGQESLRLLGCIQNSLEEFFFEKRVLDLGSGAGALALSLGSIADQILGIELAAKAVVWSGAVAEAQGYCNVRFSQGRIGQPAADLLMGTESGQWDTVVFNPPMVLSADERTYPHRNGGPFGVELPLKFLDFSWRHLGRGGHVFCLATNPIVHNRSILFDRISRSQWDLVDSQCLHSQFNQSVYRKEGYAERGIERVELWYLHLRKKP